MDLPFIPLSTRVLFALNGRLKSAHLPREIGGMVRALTGFRQVARISVTSAWYRLAPWRRDARSLAPQGAPWTYCSSWWIAVRPG
jgi:hypothetical protein